MLKAKPKDEVRLPLPAGFARKLKLKEGDTIEAKVEKGKLIILGRKNRTANIMQYAGIWQDENVDKVFSDIRKGWDKWQKSISA